MGSTMRLGRPCASCARGLQASHTPGRLRDLAVDRIEDCVGFLVGKAAQQIARRARDKLAPHGVTPVQYAVLHALWERDGRSGAEIGARLSIDSATATGVIDRLEAADLLRRSPDPEDRRVHRLFLTGRGRSLRAARRGDERPRRRGLGRGGQGRGRGAAGVAAPARRRGELRRNGRCSTPKSPSWCARTSRRGRS